MSKNHNLPFDVPLGYFSHAKNGIKARVSNLDSVSDFTSDMLNGRNKVDIESNIVLPSSFFKDQKEAILRRVFGSNIKYGSDWASFKPNQTTFKMAYSYAIAASVAFTMVSGLTKYLNIESVKNIDYVLNDSQHSNILPNVTSDEITLYLKKQPEITQQLMVYEEGNTEEVLSISENLARASLLSNQYQNQNETELESILSNIVSVNNENKTD